MNSTFLVSVKKQFDFEECLFKSARDPDIKKHKQEHESFIKSVAQMEHDYLNSFFDLRGALDYTVKWFMNHTQVEDRKFVEFYINSKKKN